MTDSGKRKNVAGPYSRRLVGFFQLLCHLLELYLFVMQLFKRAVMLALDKRKLLLQAISHMRMT